MTQEKLHFSQWNPIIAENFVKVPPGGGQLATATRKESGRDR